MPNPPAVPLSQKTPLTFAQEELHQRARLWNVLTSICVIAKTLLEEEVQNRAKDAGK